MQFTSIIVTLSLCVFELSSESPVEAKHSLDLQQVISDSCDWSGSGSFALESYRSITPIYLRCSYGTVKWLYPTGGLRVLLSVNDKDFSGCIRVAKNSYDVRIYIEGKRQLYEIYSYDDGKHPDLFRCFKSVNSYIALLIEAQHTNVHSESLIFSYDLEIPIEPSPEDSIDMCQMCSETHVLSLFCSTDFVISGKILHYKNNPDIEATEIVVMPTYIYRLYNESTYIDRLNSSPTTTADSPWQMDYDSIQLYRSLECAPGINFISQYLFLGRKKLGDLYITCTIELTYWKTIRDDAIRRGVNQCYLD